MPKSVNQGSNLCKGCGKEVVWATDDHGTRHILDPSPPTYVIIEYPGHPGQFRAVRSMAYVSHVAICPMASQASMRGHQAQPEALLPLDKGDV